MRQSYLDTFQRNKALFLVPVVLAMALATWVNLGEPKMYRSSAAIWFGTVGGASGELTGGTPPAAVEQSLLNELLTTAYFRNQVARKSPLLEYLKRGPSEGWGPTALLAKARGSGAVEDRVDSALSPKHVTSIVKGPHVLNVNYDAPTPILAKETLRVLLQEYAAQRSTLQRDALSHYKEQVRDASAVLADARADLESYVRENPGRSTTSDPHLRRLAELQNAALERLDDASAAFDQASAAALSPTTAQGRLRIVDRPKLPTAPSRGLKGVALALFAGLFAGAVISALGVVALTGMSRRTRREEGGPEALDRVPRPEDSQRVAAARQRSLYG